nr:hypothetical protein BaRGS_029092 [Batillaria attramentaria]
MTIVTTDSLTVAPASSNQEELTAKGPFKAKEVLKTSTMAVIIILASAVLPWGGLLAIAGPKHTSACLFDPALTKPLSMVYVTQYYLQNKKILDIFDVFVYATALPAFFIIVIIITTVITAAKTP